LKEREKRMGIGYEICIMETFLGFDVFDSLEIFFDFGLFFGFSFRLCFCIVAN